jgi:hypothetical protein
LPRTLINEAAAGSVAAREVGGVLSNYVVTMLVSTVAGALIGAIVGAIFGYAGNEVGFWGVGLLLGMMYGTLVGFSLAEPA